MAPTPVEIDELLREARAFVLDYVPPQEQAEDYATGVADALAWVSGQAERPDVWNMKEGPANMTNDTPTHQAKPCL